MQMQILLESEEAAETLGRIQGKMQQWGVTVTFLARAMRVSRQYVWQIIRGHTSISAAKAQEIEQAIDQIIERRTHLQTFGDRLRAARISAGLTLKQVAQMIGYTWVGVERWEKNVCRPKPGVLWHLCSLYNVNGGWLVAEMAFPAGSAHPRTAPNPLTGARAELARSMRQPGNSPELLYINPISYPDRQPRRARSADQH